MSTVKIKVRDLSCFYGSFQALDSLNLEVRACEILGLMGPAKSGKSTFLRILNRMSDLIPECRVTGTVLLDDENILARDYDLDCLRRRLGMVFAKPIPLPRSVYENLAFAPRLHGKKKRAELDELVEWSLKAAQLWD